MTRRSLFSMVHTKTNHYTLKIDDKMQSRIDVVSNRLNDIVNKYQNVAIPFNTEAANAYEQYEINCKMESESFNQFEIYEMVYSQNKHWLSLKVSGILAMLDMSDYITIEHFTDAQSIVENSLLNLSQVINRPEKYELLVDWLLSHGMEESEYTLTQKLPFYKDIKNKRQFIELMKGYAYDKNLTLMIQEKHNVTFYSAKGRKKVNLEEPLLFSYSNDMAKGYFDNDDITWKDLYKVVTSDKGICYSAHGYKDGHRTKDNANEGFELVILDVDANVSLDMAKLLFEDYTYLICTTRSHQVEKNGKTCDRFRIILPMKDRLELNKDEYSMFYKAMIEDLPIEVDSAVSDISRMFFSASGEYWYNEGMLFNATKYIPNTQESEVYQKEGTRLAKKNINGIGQYIIRNEGNGRNNQLAKYALLLMDTGYSHDECKEEVLKLNRQFQSPLAEQEIRRTLFKTIERKEEIEIDDTDDYEEDEFSKVDR